MWRNQIDPNGGRRCSDPDMHRDGHSEAGYIFFVHSERRDADRLRYCPAGSQMVTWRPFAGRDMMGIPRVIYSYPVALTLGVPAFFIARCLGWLSSKAVFSGGAGGTRWAHTCSPGDSRTIVAGCFGLSPYGSAMSVKFYLQDHKIDCRDFRYTSPLSETQI